MYGPSESDTKWMVFFMVMGLIGTFIGLPFVAWKVIAFLYAHLAWVS